MSDGPAHETSISMTRPVPAELEPGTDILLQVKVSCSSGCNLQGGKTTIANHAGAATEDIELTSLDGAASKTEEFVIKAPDEPGEYAWTAVFPSQEHTGIRHGESVVPFSFVVKPKTIKPPEHVVTIEVTGRDTKAPIKNVRIILRPLLYRGITYTDYTDDTGVAHTSVPEDEYMIIASSDGYRSFSARFVLTDDVAFKTELWVGTDVHDLSGYPLQEA
jgi:hypothetical protein